MILNSHHQIHETVTKPVLVVLHGLFGSWDNWANQIKRTAKTQSVIGIDLRNHGNSPHENSMNYDNMAEDVIETLADLKVGSAIILGHSMGGKVALSVAEKISSNTPTSLELAGLVIVDIAPRHYQPTHNTIIEALTRLDPRTLKSRKEADLALAPDIPDSPTRQFLLKNLKRHTDGGYEWTLNLTVIAREYPRLLEVPKLPETFQKPFLLITGSESEYVSGQDIVDLRKWAPKLVSHRVQGAGHWPHATHPEEMNQLLSDFL